MKHIAIFFLPLLVLACSTTVKMYTAYPDWDTNHDNKVQRNEFVEGYIQGNYFNKWGGGSSSIRYENLYTNAFRTMDQDGDEKLTLGEFDAQIKLFYFGLFRKSFAEWDNNQDSVLDKNEFVTHAAKTDLASLWDTNSDNRISKNEMAGGMFYLCDADSDGTVNEAEFNAWRLAR